MMTQQATAPITEPHEAAPAMPLLFRDAVGCMAVAVLAVGRKTGMLNAVMNGTVTAADLADECHVDARNAAAWLAAMAAHGYLTHAHGSFTMPELEVAAFRGQMMPFDFDAIIDFALRAPASLEAVAQAVRTGDGVAPSVYQQVLGDSVARVNAPLYRALLYTDWLAKAGVVEELKRGISVTEIGCGNGEALLDLAAQCPASQFAGYDVDRGAINAASHEAHRRGLSNVRFCVEDADQQLSPCDLVLVLDAFHQFPRPDVLLGNIRAALRPRGKLVLAEASMTGNIDADLLLPWARIVFSTNLLLCLQEGLYDNGAGIGSTAGKEVIEKLLANNGFGAIEAYETPVGYTVFVAAS